ncbi:hypothetical protein ACOSQ3_022807 [Xanthoceras sorbifolium]
MEGNESFMFIAQSKEVDMGEEQDLRAKVNPLEKSTSSSLKRARSNQDVEERGKSSMINFKSTLLRMSNPQHWKGLGCDKEIEKLEFKKGDITIIPGPEGPDMDISDELQEKFKEDGRSENNTEVHKSKVDEAPNSYGPWLTVSYNKNKKIINSQRNIKFEGRTERDNMEGYRVKETKRSNGESIFYHKGGNETRKEQGETTHSKSKAGSGLKVGGSRFEALSNQEGDGEETQINQEKPKQNRALFDITNLKQKNKFQIGNNNDAAEFGKKIKENNKQIGKQSKGGVSKGKAIFSVIDTAGQETKEKKTNYSSKCGIFQYQVKEPPDMVIEKDNTMDKTWVIQQLHKDIASFKGNKKPSSLDTAGQGTKEKKTNYSSKCGIFQYQVKEPPDMVIEKDNTMDETWVIQQLHKDIASFEGNKKPSSREYEKGDDTMLEK